jgi:hypothetical protein
MMIYESYIEREKGEHINQKRILYSSEACSFPRLPPEDETNIQGRPQLRGRPSRVVQVQESLIKSNLMLHKIQSPKL